jgi:hypothetical protein
LPFVEARTPSPFPYAKIEALPLSPQRELAVPCGGVVRRIHQNLIAEQQTGRDFAQSQTKQATVVSSAGFAEVLRIIFSVPPSWPRNYKLANPNLDSAGPISVYKLQQDLSLGKRSLAACYGGPWFGGVAAAADSDNERGEKP